MDDNDETEKRERVLLRPWLENLIESGFIPSLEWIDEAKTTFKVPWKHRSKKTWSLQHSSIFLEWAKNTGRWNNGDPEPNYAQLKTRLRCAFNKAPDIEEMKDLHRTKTEEPYKVYKFIPRKETKLYPFGRRPIRKTTIPITIKRRCFLMSRMSTVAANNSSSFYVHRIKCEKDHEMLHQNFEDVSPINGNVYNQTWNHVVPQMNRDPQLDLRDSYVSPSDGCQEINRILPLIVEEENKNMTRCYIDDVVQLSIEKEKEFPAEVDSVLPDVRRREKSSKEKEKEKGGRISNQLNDNDGLINAEKSWCKDPSLLCVNSKILNLPQTDVFNDNNNLHPQPFLSPQILTPPENQICQLNNDLQPSVNLINGREELLNCPVIATASNQSKDCQVNTLLVPNFALSPLTEKREDKSVESSFKEEHRTSLPSETRLFPLKHRYKNDMMVASKAISPKDRRENGFVVGAFALSYDRKPKNNLSSSSIDIKAIVDVKKLKSLNGIGLESSEEEVIDLSKKFTNKESEFKVMDLTKKMVVTPFERHTPILSTLKNKFFYLGSELNENLLQSDAALISSMITEILQFKSEYKQRKQLIITKMVFLVEKEHELRTREKQLRALEEALFWKESYLTKVMLGSEENGFTKEHLHVSLVGTKNVMTQISSSMNIVPPGPVTDVTRLKYKPSVAASIIMSRPPLISAASGLMSGSQTNALTIHSPSQQPQIIHINPTDGHFVDMEHAILPHFDRSIQPPVDRSMQPLADNRPSADGLMSTPADKSVLSLTDVNSMTNELLRRTSSEKLGSNSCSTGEVMNKSYLFNTELGSRKRGRPRGSKNKKKMMKRRDESLRYMPPLLIIPPPSMRDGVVSAPDGRHDFPIHVVRNESKSMDDNRIQSSPAIISSELINRDEHFTINHQMTSLDDKTNRVLPPIESSAPFNSFFSSEHNFHNTSASSHPRNGTNPFLQFSQGHMWISQGHHQTSNDNDAALFPSQSQS